MSLMRERTRNDRRDVDEGSSHRESLISTALLLTVSEGIQVLGVRSSPFTSNILDNSEVMSRTV